MNTDSFGMTFLFYGCIYETVHLVLYTVQSLSENHGSSALGNVSLLVLCEKFWKDNGQFVYFASLKARAKHVVPTIIFSSYFSLWIFSDHSVICLIFNFKINQITFFFWLDNFEQLYEPKNQSHR